jgi:hypothetical protein
VFAGGGVVGGAQEDGFVAAEVQVGDMCGEVSTYSYTTDLVDVLSLIRGRGGRGQRGGPPSAKKDVTVLGSPCVGAWFLQTSDAFVRPCIRMHARDGIQMPQCMSAGWRIVEASQ